MLIRIRNGITRHPDWRMAEPVNLEILPGEQVAIVGNNASGKSRLVEILTGHYPLLQNEVEYDFGPGAHRLVSENLRYISFRDSYGEADGTYYYQQRWNQHDIDENMPKVDGQPIITLSSGELRKFQLNRALRGNPKGLILDNPFIGLDILARSQLRETLDELIREKGLQVILVLSRSEEIPPFITHILPVRDLRLLPKQTREEYLKEVKNEEIRVKNNSNSIPLVEEVKAHSDLSLSASPILHFQNVTIRYGERVILKDLNWIVYEGERWALTGPNGSGKSTLLSLVCADNPQAYACNISLFGRRRGTGESIWEIKRHIGYVSPEMHRAYKKDLPAIDIVASGLRDSVGLYVRPNEREKEACLDWMRVMGIEELADRPFLKLSSGEQRLCLLARAFVKDPELLILDEPLHGLDESRRAWVKDVIQTFCQRPHKTLIMVTHYEEELPPCITHRITLNDGRRQTNRADNV